MEKVTVVLRNGKTREMAPRYAKILLRVGRVLEIQEPSAKPKRRYKRRDMQAETREPVVEETRSGEVE